MTEFTPEWIEEQKELLSGDSTEDILESALEHYPDALDYIERQRERIAECHNLIDKVLDNRNVGMQTGDSTLEFRLAELVSYYADMQARVAELEAEQEQVCEWVDPTNNPYGDLYIPLCNEDKIFEIESINEYHYCPNCGRRIKYTESEGE